LSIESDRLLAIGDGTMRLARGTMAWGTDAMLYHWYELGHAAVTPARAAADSCRLLLNHPFNPLTHTAIARHATAALEVFERTTRRYRKPQFGITSCSVDGAEVAISEEIVWQRPFCRLIHFKRDLPTARAGRDPRLLLVAPMSGHFATLLRGTVETFLPDHEVYITDWEHAGDVPLVAGSFDLDDYVDYMRDIFRHLGGDLHVFAVCQPAVPVLAAIALMEEDNEPSVPLSMILAGGPIDTRVNPTIVNRHAELRGTEWFRRNVITSVPWPNPGFGRLVYPGFLQLTGFMTMNLDRHMQAHRDLFDHLVRGDGDSAEKHREFYDEYLAVMDLTAEFYLQTVDTAFVRHLLPRGLMTHRGRRIDPGGIRRVALMTVEGEQDDITGKGQCRAAHGLCSGIPAEHKLHFECPRVGHYGIFNGSRFRSEIATRIAEFVRARDPRMRSGLGMPPLDRKIAIAHANGRAHELAASAFSFRAANDESPAPASDLSTAGRKPMPWFATTGLVSLKLWQLAGSMFLGGWARYPRDVAESDASKRG
jgi:poly(3-hydroxybutyrate) depolymerase